MKAEKGKGQRAGFHHGDICQTKLSFSSDGSKHTLPYNRTSWHIEYYKLKEFEKKWQKQEGLADLPLTLLP